MGTGARELCYLNRLECQDVLITINSPVGFRHCSNLGETIYSYVKYLNSKEFSNAFTN